MKERNIRGGGRYEKLVVLLFTDPTKNFGGARSYLVSKITKVDGAIAPPAPPVPPPLGMIRSNLMTISIPYFFSIQISIIKR